MSIEPLHTYQQINISLDRLLHERLDQKGAEENYPCLKQIDALPEKLAKPARGRFNMYLNCLFLGNHSREAVALLGIEKVESIRQKLFSCTAFAEKPEDFQKVYHEEMTRAYLLIENELYEEMRTVLEELKLKLNVSIAANEQSILRHYPCFAHINALSSDRAQEVKGGLNALMNRAYWEVRFVRSNSWRKMDLMEEMAIVPLVSRNEENFSLSAIESADFEKRVQEKRTLLEKQLFCLQNIEQDPSDFQELVSAQMRLIKVEALMEIKSARETSSKAMALSLEEARAQLDCFRGLEPFMLYFKSELTRRLCSDVKEKEKPLNSVSEQASANLLIRARQELVLPLIKEYTVEFAELLFDDPQNYSEISVIDKLIDSVQESCKELIDNAVEIERRKLDFLFPLLEKEGVNLIFLGTRLKKDEIFDQGICFGMSLQTARFFHKHPQASLEEWRALFPKMRIDHAQYSLEVDFIEAAIKKGVLPKEERNKVLEEMDNGYFRSKYVQRTYGMQGERIVDERWFKGDETFEDQLNILCSKLRKEDHPQGLVLSLQLPGALGHTLYIRVDKVCERYIICDQNCWIAEFRSKSFEEGMDWLEQMLHGMMKAFYGTLPPQGISGGFDLVDVE